MSKFETWLSKFVIVLHNCNVQSHFCLFMSPCKCYHIILQYWHYLSLISSSLFMKHSWITASASVIVKQDILRSNALRECCCWFIVDSVRQCSDVTIWGFVKIISYKNSCFCRIYCPGSVLIGHFSVGQPEVAIRFQFSLFPGKYILQMKNCYLDTKIRKYFFCVEKPNF